ncbi:Ras- protein Rab-2A, partial [Podila clonocystis]
MDKYTPDHTFKFVVVGDSYVGKTSLVQRFLNKNPPQLHNATIVGNLIARTVTIDEKTIMLTVWDTAGQERYRAIVPLMFRNAVGALIVYDVTDRIRLHCGIATRIMVVGNKSEIPDVRRRVSKEEGKAFADGNGLLFAETSAQDNIGVEDVFVEVAQKVFDDLRESSDVGGQDWTEK